MSNNEYCISKFRLFSLGVILFGALPRSPTKLIPPSTVCCRCWLLRTHTCTHLPRSALGRPGEGAQSRWLMGMALGVCVCASFCGAAEGPELPMELGWGYTVILEPHLCLVSFPNIFCLPHTFANFSWEHVSEKKESSVSGLASKDTSNMADPFFPY